MVHSYFRIIISPKSCGWSLFSKAAFLLLIIGLLTACSDTPIDRRLNFNTTVYLNQLPLQVAVFRSREEQRQGLMHVNHLPENAGGLFVFAAETDVNFWMKHVEIELDLLFFDQQGQLSHRVEAAQPCHTLICPRFKARNIKYVLEVNAGFFKTNKLPESTYLRFSE